MAAPSDPPDVTFGEDQQPRDPGPDAFVGAFALLTDGTGRYLTMDAGEHGVIDLIRAPRLEDETYRESLLREIGWRLSIDPKRDIVCSGVPRAHLNSRLCGGGSGEPKWYICQFYVAHFFGRRWAEAVDGRSDVVWLTGADIMNGGNGTQTLRKDVRDLIGIADLIPPDER